MARPKNTLKSVQITISTTEHVIAYLDQLVQTGFYGNNPTEAAERLLATVLEERLGKGQLQRFSPPSEDRLP